MAAIIAANSTFRSRTFSTPTPVYDNYRVVLILRCWCPFLIESERQLICQRLSKVGLLTIAALCLAALGGFSAWFINKYFGVEAQALAVRIWPPPTTDQVERKELRKIADWFSLDCGHVRYRENADRAIACAHNEHARLAMEQSGPTDAFFLNSVQLAVSCQANDSRKFKAGVYWGRWRESSRRATFQGHDPAQKNAHGGQRISAHQRDRELGELGDLPGFSTAAQAAQKLLREM
jgi:hypothetical protein